MHSFALTDGTTESLILLPVIYVIAGCQAYICVGGNDMLNLILLFAGWLSRLVVQLYLHSYILISCYSLFYPHYPVPSIQSLSHI